MNDSKLIVDIDGTLCPVKKKDERYEDLIPYENVVNRLREYHEKGSQILLYTARNMRTHSNSLGKINKHTAPVLFAWLEKWKIPYDEILFGKPWPMKKGFYIDDKAIRPSEFTRLSEDEIHTLLKLEADKLHAENL